MKTTKHPLATKIVKHFIEKVPVYKTGTYNRQDPTHYEKGGTLVKTVCGDAVICTHDCTWGVEIEITIDDKVYELYYERGLGYKDGIILREGTDMSVLKLIWILSQRMDPLPEEEPWMDPAGGMHYPGETDPAAQYK